MRPRTTRIVPTTRSRAGFAWAYQRLVAGAENSRATDRCQAAEVARMSATAAALTAAGSVGGRAAVSTLPKNAAAFGLVRLLTTPRRKWFPFPRPAPEIPNESFAISGAANESFAT